MGRIWSICMASLKIWVRQPVSLVVSLLVPVVVMTVFGFVFGGMSGGDDDSRPIRAMFVDEDNSEASADLLTALQDLEGIRISTGDKSDDEAGEVAWTRESALQEIRDGGIGMAVVVPEGFAEDLENVDFESAATSIDLLSDSRLQVDNAILEGMLMQVSFMTAGSQIAGTGMEFMGEDLGLPAGQVALMRSWMEQNAQFGNMSSGTDDDGGGNGSGGALIDVNVVDVLGEDKDNPVFSHQVAGVLTMFMLFTVAASGGSLLRERQNGTIRRILISSTSPAHYLLGKYIAFFLIAYLQTWVMLLAGWLIFRVDIFSHLPALAVFGALVALAATSFGILLASVCRTVEQVSSFSTLLILVMSAIGGSMMPRQFMPEALQRMGDFTFNGWAMTGFTGIFWYGKDLAGILIPCCIMLGLAVVLFAIAARLFSSRLAY